MPADPVPSDWQARARREAAAILDECQARVAGESYQALVGLVAIGWLQGVNYGTHATLADVEAGFERLQAELT